MKFSRREFIKHCAAATAYASLPISLTNCSNETSAFPEKVELDPNLTWNKAPCRFCGTGCGVMVGTQNGKVVAVAGDQLNPVNKGLLCIKGYSLPGILYGEDRLTKPLIRSNGKFKEATWDAALDLVASKYKEALDRYGPEAVAIYGSGQWTISDGYAALKWFKGGIGSNNVEANARLCMASAVTGFMTTFGADEPMGCYDDFEKGDAFVLWGNNMAEMHPVLFSRILERKRKASWVQIIDLATRKTPTTEWADMHLSMAPQSDLAIANAIARHIINTQRYDKDFVNQHTVFRRGKENIGYGLEDNFSFKDDPRPMSFDEYKAYVQKYTPEHVEKISGIPAGKIKQLAEIYADKFTKVVSLWCMGMNQHNRGTWINNLVYNLHLLTGKICKPGNNPLSLTGQPSACGTVREVGTLAHRLPADMVVMNPVHREKAAKIWGVPAKRIPTKPGYNTVEMFRAFDRGDIRVLWTQTTNPMVSMPNLIRYREGAQKDGRFLVVSDVYPTPTTEIADVVLPAAMWVEREGFFGNTERRTQHWQKMVEPPGEAKADVWQTMEVAKRMGYGDLFNYDEAMYERELFEEYRQFTLGTGHDLGTYEQYVEARGLRWPVVNGRETPYRYTARFDPYVAEGKQIEFYSNNKTGGRAVVWARPYEPAPEIPDSEFPFWLTTGRVLEHWHTGSMTRRILHLHRAVPEAYVELHPDDASELGIQNGEKVRVRSRRGAVELKVVLDGKGKPRRGSVFVPFFDESKLINEVTLDSYCPISKEPDYKKCAVTVEKLQAI
ncbi:molybdopterin-dependent oxidoreductase [candidate division KSB1 bacterium]|nr:molybdopterin-dependent oxidoreductase [candidate division KSB1 bacterium]NIR69406.1 molybdopterin-dependent oxidoreductase [candidate division KSB1 bacterium]NIS22756.1 molybdopterin-dependent oxidoreductase [candidate division KSB1 bacterium]NIT69603.1 molybdopterin-dependent oxidoreductase [candidate division KSB1 bacterium]NIU23264.1 molybdopterin-dependent oxidoreductase [candidate division KSB1 bacterium]